MPTITDHLEAILARVTTRDLELLSPAALQRLADRAYQVHCWAAGVAGQKPFLPVKRRAGEGANHG